MKEKKALNEALKKIDDLKIEKNDLIEKLNKNKKDLNIKIAN